MKWFIVRISHFHQNNSLDTEQPVSSTIEMIKKSNPIGTNEPVLNAVASATSMLGVVVSFPVETSIPTTPRPTHASLVDPRLSYMSCFTMPLVSRDFLFGMPTGMMEGLQSNTLTYADDNATLASPLNPYVVSGPVISHLGRATQHGGLHLLSKTRQLLRKTPCCP